MYNFAIIVKKQRIRLVHERKCNTPYLQIRQKFIFSEHGSLDNTSFVGIGISE